MVLGAGANGLFREGNRDRDKFPKSARLVGIRAILLVVNLDHGYLNGKLQPLRENDD